MSGGDAYDEGVAVDSGAKAIDAVFEDDAVFGLAAEVVGRADVAVGEGFAASCIFGGEHVVEVLRKVRKLLGKRIHFLLIAAGDDGADNTATTGFVHKVEGAGEKLVTHGFLEGIETFVNNATYLRICEIRIVNCCKRGTLDARGEVRNVGKEFAADGSPELLVLTFGVDDDAIEVEEEDAAAEDFAGNNLLGKIVGNVVVEALAHFGRELLAGCNEGCYGVGRRSHEFCVREACVINVVDDTGIEVVACADGADGVNGGNVEVFSRRGTKEGSDGPSAVGYDETGTKGGYTLIDGFGISETVEAIEIFSATAHDGGEAHVLFNVTDGVREVGNVGGTEVDVVIEDASGIVGALKEFAGVGTDDGIDGKETAEHDNILSVEVGEMMFDVGGGMVFVELVTGVVVFVEEGE